MIIRTAEIISVGTELLLGDIVNTDAAFISKRLAALGISQYHQSTVGDNSARLGEVLAESLSRSDLVILTGGLGPTYDDLTKETAAKLMHRRLLTDPVSLSRIENRARLFGFEMTENNKKQALIPEGSTIFKNDYGTAPGMSIEDFDNGKLIILLPGPPRECEPMFTGEVEPYLRRFTEKLLLSKTLNIFGIGESKVESILRPLMLASTNPTVAPYAKDGEVQLRITASGKDENECSSLCDEMIAGISATEVGQYIYGVDAGTLEEALVKALIKSKKHIAAAESCTGGYVAKRITNVSGSSEVLDGSIVTYANRVKEQFVNVSRETLSKYGAVSSQTAIEMARGVRKLFGADIGVSTTGIAGPTGGTPDKPVGTVFVGISTGDYEEVRELHIGNGLATREYVRYISASNALHLALKAIAQNHS